MNGEGPPAGEARATSATGTGARLQEARRLDALGQHGPALFAYRLLLRLDPHCQAAKIELGGLLSILGRHQEARDLCLEVLREAPDLPAARLNLAGALMGLDDFPAADAQYRELLDQEPILAHLGLGTSLDRQGRLGEARAALERLLALEPGHRQGREVLLRVLIQQRDWPAARQLWTRIAMGLPAFEATLEQAVIHLTFGDFQRGWELMERRLDQPGFIQPQRHFKEPRWDGAAFPGRTLLLHWEQGYGDTLMFIRYAALAKARGGRVLALVQAPLRTLVASAPGVDQALAPGEPLPPFDLHCPLFSLPWLFGTRLDTIPASIPYLRADPGPYLEALPDQADRNPQAGQSQPGPDLQARLSQPGPDLQSRLSQAGQGPRVGLAWAGSLDNRNDALRSIALEQLAPLAEVPGVAWHSLQVGPAGGLPFAGILDLAPVLPDFNATAQALAAMDLVITVDTAVAHLAGALGRPTWLLLPFLPEWRWLLDREDSPWYPSFRIFRQEVPNQWQGVLARVRAALLERLRGTC